MIRFTQKGDFSKTMKYLKKVKVSVTKDLLDRYGRMGVEALSRATPVDTGLTAASWYYTTEITKERASLTFHNSNIQNGVPIAIILQYGHGTRNGGWVEGRDYINPAIQPIFDELANKAWWEVVKT